MLNSNGCRRLYPQPWHFLPPIQIIPEMNPLPNESLLDEIPAEEMILRNAADFLYGMALARRGQTRYAVEISIKCIERERSQQGSTVFPTLASFVTRIYLIMGRLNTCADLCHEYLDPIKESGIPFCLYFRQHEDRPGRGDVRMEFPGRG